MSESAKRAGAEEIKCGRKEKKAAERKLREEMAQAGFDTEGRPSKRNGKCRTASNNGCIVISI